MERIYRKETVVPVQVSIHATVSQVRFAMENNPAEPHRPTISPNFLRLM